MILKIINLLKLINVSTFILLLNFSNQVRAESQFKNITDTTINSSVNNSTKAASSIVKTYLSTLFPTVEVEMSSGLTNSITGGILVVAPLSEPKDIYNTIFLQGSLFVTHEDRYRQTVNIGLGNRLLLIDKKLLIGVNGFYDHEFPYNHQRISAGFEARSSIGELNANKYYRISGWESGYNNLNERTLDGHDFEVGFPLPYVNWAKIYGKLFKWEGSNESANLRGDQLSLKASLPFGFSIEGGRKNYSSSGYNDENFIKLTWNSNQTSDEQSLKINNDIYTLKSMEENRYDKVRRENLIIKETDAEFIVVGF